MSGLQRNLPAVLPFSFHSVVHSHGWYQLSPFIFRTDGVLETVLGLNSGRIIVVEIQASDNGVGYSTAVELGDSDLKDLDARIIWMLDLDRNLNEFYGLTAHEPALQHVHAQARGRLLRSPTVFEDVVKTILTTNTSWAGTKRMVSSLVELYGEEVERSGCEKGCRAFPTPEALAAVSAEALRENARLGYRAPYVHDLALAVAGGDLDLESLKHCDLSSDDLNDFLLGIRGVGPYAAAHLTLLLGHYDRIPVDSWARKMVSEEWYDGASVGAREVQERFDKWGEWKALAYWFWDWKYLKTVDEQLAGK